MTGLPKHLVSVIFAVENFFDFQAELRNFLRNRKRLGTPDLDRFDGSGPIFWVFWMERVI